LSATRCGRGVDQETCDMSGTIVESTLTCPHCGRQSLEAMPVDACRFFHECAGCGAMLQPLPGDCCVFCSYGSVPCPPVQQGRACC
jgi:hypothetical protein